MMEKEFKDKLQEYSKRHRFWTNASITQLGYSINLFTTVGIAFIGYIVSIRDNFSTLSISCNSQFNFTLALYILASLSTIFSIIMGFSAVFSRLVDFKITRQILFTRKRFLARIEKKAKTNRTKGLLEDKIIDISNERHIRLFLKYLRKDKQVIITEHDYRIKDSLKEKFHQLRKDAKVLGELTWRFHRLQILSFILAVTSLVITIIK